MRGWIIFLSLILLFCFIGACSYDGDVGDDSEGNEGFSDNEDDSGGGDNAGPGQDLVGDDDLDDDAADDDTAPAAAGEFCFSVLPGELNLPVPSDFFTFDDPTTPTGKRVYFPPDMPPVFMRLYEDYDFIAHAHNRLDGFSVIAPAYLPVTTPVQVNDAAGSEPTADDAVIVLDMTPGRKSYGELVPVKTLYSPTYRAVKLRPRFSFADQGTYLIVVTDKVRATSGGHLAVTEQFAYLQQEDADYANPLAPALEGYRRQYQPLWDFLRETTGLEPSEVLLAFTYTTQSVMQDFAAIYETMEQLRETNPPQMLDVTITYPTGGEFGAEVHGWLKVPDWQGRDGVFERDPYTHQPVFDRWLRIPFLLLLPRHDSAYEQPYHAAIYQHWSSGRKEDARNLPGQMLARNGVAVIAIDAVCHGERAGNPDLIQSALCFYDVFNPLIMRDNFRQTVADQLRLTHLLQSLTELDILPEGGDGVPDLDPSRLFYQSDSLGSIIGMMSAATNPYLEGYFLIAGSGYLTELGVQSIYAEMAIEIFGWLEDIFDLDVIDDTLAMVDLWQGVFDAGDPMGFAPYVHQPAAYMGEPKQMIYIVPAYDDVLPHFATEYVVRAARLPLVEPYVYPVQDVETIPLPAYERGYIQVDTEDHGMFYGGGEVAERARAQYEHFLRTLLDTGTGEIIDPDTMP